MNKLKMYTLALKLMQKDGNYPNRVGLCHVLTHAICLEKFNMSYDELQMFEDGMDHMQIWKYITKAVQGRNDKLIEISKHKPKGNDIFWPITQLQRIHILEQAIKEVNPTETFYYG